MYITADLSSRGSSHTAPGSAVLMVFIASLLLLSISFDSDALPLSPGDRVELQIAGDTYFSGRYQIDLQGRVPLPHLEPITIAEYEPRQATDLLREELVRSGMLSDPPPPVSLSVIQWAPIEVTVSGGVFYPGRVQLNSLSNQKGSDDDELPGADYPRRFLTDALRAAGGVRPEALVEEVVLKRGEEIQTIDLYPIFNGSPCSPIPLVNGDLIIVPTGVSEREILMRPSRITPPGIKVFVSNLLDAVGGNGIAALDPSIAMAYGSRFSQGVVASNCAGGTKVSSRRRAALIRTTRSGARQVWDSRLEKILGEEDDVENPFLLEGDSIVCYDSRLTNFRETFRILRDITWPLFVF